MKFRDLHLENPNHFRDWLSVKHYSIYGNKLSQEETNEFISKWQDCKATRSDWIKNEKINVAELLKGLEIKKRDEIILQQHKLFDWWLEYKVRFKYLAELQNVITYAPWRAREYAEQKLKELEKYLSGSTKGLEIFRFANSFGLQPNVDYIPMINELAETFENFDQIYDFSFRHEAAAILRCLHYLKRIVREGIDEEPGDESEPEEFCFERFWPEIIKLSRKIIVEYKVKYSYYEDNRYASYQVIGISGISTGYGLKQKLVNLYKAGFDKLMTELIRLDKDEQLNILNGLKDENEALASVTLRGEYKEQGDEFNNGRSYEFDYFPQAQFKGDADIQLSTSEKSRLYLAKGMTEYPEAWLEGISFMERKLEHAINNLELFNVRVKNPIYDVKSILQQVFIIESVEGVLQGTAFQLSGFGLVTCYHCVGDGQSNTYFNDLLVYKADDLKKKFPVKVLRANQNIDIAILEIENENFALVNKGLTKGNSDSVSYLDTIAVAGFPNYNYGDTGYFTIGQVTGFRTISGIAHVLVSNVLVAGNSGGPAFDENGNVIGIVVTGSEAFLNSEKTEKHGLIPINAIDFLF